MEESSGGTPNESYIPLYLLPKIWSYSGSCKYFSQVCGEKNSALDRRNRAHYRRVSK